MTRMTKFWALRAAAGLAVMIAVAAACDGPRLTEPHAPEDPLFTIADAARGYKAGFYWLPPMVKNPSTSGAFDPALSPTVEICELDADEECESTLVTFTMDGSGSETVRLDPEGEHYIVNWHTNEFGLTADAVYRVSVFAGDDVLLGYADVQPVSSGKDLRNVNTNEYIGLIDGRTLPVKFRIETGIVARIEVDPPEAEIAPGEAKQFAASLFDLHGQPMSGTVDWASDDEAVATIDPNGLATAVAEGVAEITASAEQITGSATLNVGSAVPSAFTQVEVELRGGDGSVLTSDAHWIQFDASNDNVAADPCGNGNRRCFDGDLLAVKHDRNIQFRYMVEGPEGVTNSSLHSAGSFGANPGQVLRAEFATTRFDFSTNVSNLPHPGNFTTRVQGYGTLGNPLVDGSRRGEVVHLAPGQTYAIRPSFGGVGQGTAIAQYSAPAGSNQTFTSEFEMSVLRAQHSLTPPPISNLSGSGDFVDVEVRLRGGDGEVLGSGAHWIQFDGGNTNVAADPCGNGDRRCFDGDVLSLRSGRNIQFRYLVEGSEGASNSSLQSAGSFSDDPGQVLTGIFATTRFNYSTGNVTGLSHPGTWTTRVQNYGTLGNPLPRDGEVAHLAPGQGYPVRPDFDGLGHSPAIATSNEPAGSSNTFTTKLGFDWSVVPGS